MATDSVTDANPDAGAIEALAALLVESGAVSRRVVDGLLEHGAADGGARLLALGAEHEHALGEVLAERDELPCVLLGSSTLDLTLLAGLSPEVLLEGQLLPLALQHESLTVAVASPGTAARALQDLAVQTGRHVVAVVAVPALLRQTTERALRAHNEGSTRLRGAISATADVELVLARPPAPVTQAEIDDVARALGEVLIEHRAPPALRGPAIGMLRLKQIAVPAPPPALPSTPTTTTNDDAFELAAGDAIDDVDIDLDALEPEVVTEPGDDDGVIEELAPIVDLAPPAEDSSSSRPRPTPPLPAGLRRPFALVVEDDEAIGALLCRTLAADGCETEHLTSGEGVADALRRRRPDIILLDAMLPGVHGFEICAALKHSPDWRDVPIAMVSAIYRSFDEVKEIHERHGADVFIEKPFQIEHVRRVVADLLRRPAPVEPHHALKALSASRARALVDHHLTVGDVDAASGILDRWIAAEPLSARAWLERGHLAIAAGDHFRALQAYELAALYDRRLFMAQMSLAQLCQQLGFVRKAKTAWQIAAGCAPDVVTAERIRQALA